MPTVPTTPPPTHLSVPLNPDERMDRNTLLAIMASIAPDQVPLAQEGMNAPGFDRSLELEVLGMLAQRIARGCERIKDDHGNDLPLTVSMTFGMHRVDHRSHVFSCIAARLDQQMQLLRSYLGELPPRAHEWIVSELVGALMYRKMQGAQAENNAKLFGLGGGKN